jgi:hypothetical protein
MGRMTADAPAYLPYGTEAITAWAGSRGMANQPRPDQAWFRGWEPFDTLLSPAYYFNACTWNLAPGTITVVEPWTELINTEPVDRALYAFVAHPGLQRRASMRAGGEHFMSRVSVIADPPPPEQEVGDPVWDEHVVTHANSAQVAREAFTGPLRQLLQGWGFRGHVELRSGGAIIYAAEYKPSPQDYDRLLRTAQQIVDAALRRA